MTRRLCSLRNTAQVRRGNRSDDPERVIKKRRRSFARQGSAFRAESEPLACPCPQRHELSAIASMISAQRPCRTRRTSPPFRQDQPGNYTQAASGLRRARSALGRTRAYSREPANFAAAIRGYYDSLCRGVLTIGRRKSARWRDAPGRSESGRYQRVIALKVAPQLPLACNAVFQASRDGAKCWVDTDRAFQSASVKPQGSGRTPAYSATIVHPAGPPHSISFCRFRHPWNMRIAEQGHAIPRELRTLEIVIVDPVHRLHCGNP